MARNYNGSSDFISGSFPVPFKGSGFPQSTSCWFLTSSNYSGGFVPLFMTNAVVNCYTVLLLNSGGPVVQLGKYNVAGLITSGNNYSLTNWNHVAVTYDGVGSGAIYLNGVATTATGLATTMADMATFLFGKDPGSGRLFVSGTAIAEMACWNAFLTAAEARQLYYGARANTIRPASRFGDWPFDLYFHPALDRSVFANNATLNGTTFTPGPPLINAGPPVIISSLPKQGPPPPPFVLMPQCMT